MPAVDDALHSLVESEAPFLAFTEDKKKIVCTLNNHELPVRLDVVQTFVGYELPWPVMRRGSATWQQHSTTACRALASGIPPF
jgi:hypothetical protein